MPSLSKSAQIVSKAGAAKKNILYRAEFFWLHLEFRLLFSIRTLSDIVTRYLWQKVVLRNSNTKMPRAFSGQNVCSQSKGSIYLRIVVTMDEKKKLDDVVVPEHICVLLSSPCSIKPRRDVHHQMLMFIYETITRALMSLGNGRLLIWLKLINRKISEFIRSLKNPAQFLKLD